MKLVPAPFSGFSIKKKNNWYESKSLDVDILLLSIRASKKFSIANVKYLHTNNAAVFSQKDVKWQIFEFFYFYGFWGFLECSFRWWYWFVLIMYGNNLKWSVKETFVTQKEYFILQKRRKIHIFRKKTHLKFNILQIDVCYI